jgi:hypothetical protein
MEWEPADAGKHQVQTYLIASVTEANFRKYFETNEDMHIAQAQEGGADGESCDAGGQGASAASTRSVTGRPATRSFVVSAQQAEHSASTRPALDRLSAALFEKRNKRHGH